MDNMYIYKDDRFSIYMCKDHWHGLVVQVCRSAPTGVAVAWSKSVKADDPQFKKQLAYVIAQAREQLAILRSGEDNMDGAFADYKDQCAWYNTKQKE